MGRKHKRERSSLKEDQHVRCSRCGESYGTLKEYREFNKVLGYDDGIYEDEIGCPICWSHFNYKVYCSNCDEHICEVCLTEDHEDKDKWTFEEWSKKVRADLIPEHNNWVTNDQLKELYDQGRTISAASFFVMRMYNLKQRGQ